MEICLYSLKTWAEHETVEFPADQTFISQNVLINRIRSIQKFQHFRTGRDVRRVYISVYNIYSRAQKSENLYYCHINLSESNISQKSRTVMTVAGLSEQYRDSRDLDQYPTHRTEQRNIQQLILMFPTDLCTQHITPAASFYQWSTVALTGQHTNNRCCRQVRVCDVTLDCRKVNTHEPGGKSVVEISWPSHGQRSTGWWRVAREADWGANVLQQRSLHRTATDSVNLSLIPAGLLKIY